MVENLYQFDGGSWSFEPAILFVGRNCLFFPAGSVCPCVAHMGDTHLWQLLQVKCGWYIQTSHANATLMPIGLGPKCVVIIC